MEGENAQIQPAAKLASQPVTDNNDMPLEAFEYKDTTVWVPPTEDVPERIEIAKLLGEKQLGNRIVMKAASTRNIILLGRSRAGKSTLLRMLKHPTHIPQSVQFFAQTQDPVLNSFTVERGGHNYGINVLDTPGLFERSASNTEVRCNALIKALIVKCLEFEIRYIHTAFFACSFEGGINSQDVQAIIELNRLFKGADKVFHLLITRSEGKTLARRQLIETQVRAVPELSEFFANPDVKVFFSGTLVYDDFAMLLNKSMKDKLETVMNMRTLLYDHIIASETYAHITQMEIYKQIEADLNQMQADIQQKMQVLATKGEQDAERAKLQQELGVCAAQLKEITGSLARVTGQDRQAVLNETVDAAYKAAGLTTTTTAVL
eukprot:TRINITY_DN773_c0_g1_i5.p1 TRINITY_DN773_c0_g1~~TRINITY_DN773_c0_g1_i5.p1  ORF type:complete len:406 (-),score=105.33 TRINITY_DN773_c0_g1_i5:72-1202(-)